jgi:hypothetical protein
VPLMENETIVGRLYSTIDTNTLIPRYVDYVMNFLDQHKEDPFFLVFSSLSSHFMLSNALVVLCTGWNT